MVDLSTINLSAVVPDQLLNYVGAVSGLKSMACGSCILHYGDDFGVLVGYPQNDPLDMQAFEESVDIALGQKSIKKLVTLSAFKPQKAPVNASVKEDFYWSIPLPPPAPGQKLRNMLHRASREVEIKLKPWSNAHTAMAREFCNRKKLDDGTCYIFDHLPDYLDAAKDAVLFSALDAEGDLQAFAIADYTALETAFYMFACRSSNAIPGSADLLLWEISREGEKRGHMRLNLGLGIDSGVEFFKKKWHAEQWLPCVETEWEIKKTSFFSRLFGKK